MSRHVRNGKERSVIIAPLDTNILSVGPDEIINGRVPSPSGDVAINGRIIEREKIIELLGHTHVRNSNATYVHPTTGLITSVATNIPRFESVGGLRAILLEPGETNNLLYARDLTQADWVKTNCTPLLDQIGETGIANSASSLLATAGNATCLQTLVLGAADYAYSVSIKRITGTGNIEVTDDNGGTWTDIKSSLSTTAWYRHTITQSQANPICGIRIVTNTDKIAVDYNQLEAAKIGSSRILTTTAAASRATELGYPLWTLPTGLFDAQGTCSVWVRFGYNDTDGNVGSGIVVARDNKLSLMYTDHDGDLITYDGTLTAPKSSTITINTWYKYVLKWGYDVGGNEKFRVGVDTGTGIAWGTEANFDGSYTLGTNLRLAYGLFGPMWMRDLRLYDRILTDAEINSLGSP